MKLAYSKDIFRTIKKEKKRFIALMLITLLGVCMLTGLKASCDDLRYSADVFFDKQHLFDLKILSTLGLTDADVEALKQVDGIKDVEGTFSDTVYTIHDNKKKSVELKALSEQGINVPYMIEGKLPEKENEIAVTKKYCNETGKKIGDSIVLEEGKNVTLLQTEYKICGIVIDVEDINSAEGTVAFRGNSSTDYTFFVLPQVIESEAFTAVYLTLNDTADLPCFKEEYETKIEEMTDWLEANLLEKRELARYEEITGEAWDEVNDAELEMEEEFAKAEEEIADAKKELADAKEELRKAEDTLEKEETNAKQQLLDARTQIEDGIAQIESMAAMYGGMIPQLEAQLVPLQDALKEVEIKEAEAAEKFADAYAELEEARQELVDGEAKLQENIETFESEKADAYKELEEAKQEIADMKMTEWYITDRSALSGYANMQSDADCIEAIGKAFPVIFLTVAVLISLTTITRMVEEDRGFIGTYKALGFTDKEIRKKYITYAALASLAGGILGDVFGYVVLPEILFTIFSVMYQLPDYMLGFDVVYGIGGILLFIGVIVLAAFLSCEAELKHMPASLMRPKAPRSGSRIFLERIPFIWKRLSFLNKVTARNLFRYKKRFFMTVFGIMGCTALLVCGYTIKDTVAELMPKQYETVYCYDLMLIAEDNEKLTEYVTTEEQIASYIYAGINNVKLINADGEETTVQLTVIPDDADLPSYISLFNEERETLTLTDDSIFITINAAKLLDLEVGDTIQVQTLNLLQAEVKITHITMNYMGNHIYMTASAYENLFGETELNGAFVKLTSSCSDQTAYAEEMAEKEGILSAIGTEKMRAEFEPSFKIINLVVYIVITLAAALAFVVLFTLATTNISERERELATIKVLGFYDREVHAYVNKETLILTSLGILLGLPVGKVFGEWLMAVLNLPSIYFETCIHPISYVISAGMAFIFALLVNLMTNRTLDKINPVEALKSIE